MTDEILREVTGLPTLEAVMKWAFGRTPPAESVHIVTQDEFTHDIVFKMEENLFLVFDTT